MRWLKKSRGSTKAVINHGDLVAVFSTANPPMVWNYDLEHNRNFSVMLKQGEAGWGLGVVGEAGVYTAIAQFETRDEATEAFDRVQRVLSAKKWAGLWLAVKLITGAAVLLLLVLLLARIISSQPAGMMHMGGLQGGNVRQAIPQGVPLPADLLLKVQTMPAPVMPSGLPNVGSSGTPSVGVPPVITPPSFTPPNLAMPSVEAPKPTVEEGVPQAAGDVLKAPQ